jgi:hypothetical protein
MKDLLEQMKASVLEGEEEKVLNWRKRRWLTSWT